MNWRSVRDRGLGLGARGKGPSKGTSCTAWSAFMKTLVLLRHGESTWNKENRFTGWTDVDL